MKINLKVFLALRFRNILYHSTSECNCVRTLRITIVKLGATLIAKLLPSRIEVARLPH